MQEEFTTPLEEMSAEQPNKANRSACSKASLRKARSPTVISTSMLSAKFVKIF